MQQNLFVVASPSCKLIQNRYYGFRHADGATKEEHYGNLLETGHQVRGYYVTGLGLVIPTSKMCKVNCEWLLWSQTQQWDLIT